MRWRLKARITRTPVTDSRRRVFMASTSCCILTNMGADLASATAHTASMPSVTPSTTQPICQSVAKERITAATQVTGTGASMTKHIMRVCWTTFASPMVRVIMEPVPRREKSAAESARLFWYTATRRSRATFAARCAAIQ